MATASRTSSSGTFGGTGGGASAAGTGGPTVADTVASRAVKTVIGVYVSTAESRKDFYHRQPVSTKTTVAEVVATMVSKLFGTNEKPGAYALYEAEFIDAPPPVEAYVALRDHVATNDSHLPFLKGERIIVTSKPSADTWIGECEGNTGSFPSSFVRPVLGNLKPTAERKCLRALGDAEIPLFVQYNWKNQPNGSSMTFVLKEREPELRENATAEFYANFSAEKLRTLLSQLDTEETKALEEIEAKYRPQREKYLQALQAARAKAAAAK